MKKYLSVSCAVLVPVIVIVAAIAWGLFDQQEMAVYDWLMRTRPVQRTSPEIVLIEITDDTLKALGRWPLSRDFHAALIDTLTNSGCRMVVFDILLSEPSESDTLLSKSLRRSGRVYLPLAFNIGTARQGGQVSASELLGGVAQTLEKSVAGLGHINISVDPDGKVRRVPAVIRFGNSYWPSLGMLVAAKYLGLPVQEVVKNVVDRTGFVWVNFPGPWTQTFLHYSYLDVLKAGVALQQGTSSWLDLSVFKDKICFVGLTAVGTSDFRANPIDPVYPMVGTQASVCDSVLRHAFIRRSPAAVRIGTGLVVTGLAVMVCAMLPPVAAFGICVLIAGIYCALVWSLFAWRGIFADAFFPVVCIIVSYAVQLLRKFFQEAQKRRILEKELEIAASIQRSFLPPDMRRIGSVNIRAFLKPAKYVGGDLYDIINLDADSFGVFIGDVSGKGVSASLIMAQTISLLRVLSRNSRDPGAVLYELNNQLKPLLKGRFVTGQYVIINHTQGYWEGASAGHQAGIVVNKTREGLEEVIPASGPPLGLVEKMKYTTIRHAFLPEDRVFLYTDGWTEARSPSGAEFGIESLKTIVAGTRTAAIDDALADLLRCHDSFEGRGNQYDDLTAMVFEYSK